MRLTASVSASRDAQPSAPASAYLDLRCRSEALRAARATEEYHGYPGFGPAADGLGGYNSKFVSWQKVLRGGSCATAAGRVRASDGNFFCPHQRSQFLGVRLAEDT